ncbi:hypothetical protein DFS33DRAFT_1249451, partial [Desarmillaria ectypa]
NTLFNIPKYPFEKFSEVFKTMFALPQGDSLNIDGSSDEHPLILQSVMAQEFRSLLSVMLHPKSPLLTKEAWIAVLKLSNMWRLIKVKNIALRQLKNCGNLSYIDKIVWGRDYKVADWVIMGYGGLIDCGNVLSLDKGMHIGVQGVLGIWGSQTISRGGSTYGVRRGTPSIVLEVFEEEIKDIRREAAEYVQEELSCPAPHPEARGSIPGPVYIYDSDSD